MKIVLALLASFFAVFCIAYNRQPDQISSETSSYFSVSAQKKFTIRCSPDFIPSEDALIPKLTGWGDYRWKITTSSDSAQFYFDQGINMYYAFHIIEARASFDKATRFDPECAMAWWGKALAFGPNINDFGYKRPSEAFPSANKANQLKHNATSFEKALIEAIAIRYSEDSTQRQNILNTLYSAAMKKVYQLFNKNDNAGALYADALLILHPWDLYNHNYSAKTWTPEIVSVLKHTLQINPLHPGANHYFIHAVEASAHPQDALKSASFLATAMPDVSHFTHMPSHIYIRSGYYRKGIDVNDKAIIGYKKYLNYFPSTEENIALYDLHNEHMKMNCAQMAGNYEKAMESSKSLQSKIPSFYLKMPGALGNYVQYLHQSPLFTQIRFGKWTDILSEKVNDSLSFTSVLQHFARGLAFTKTNHFSDAVAELKLMQNSIKDSSLKEVFTPFNSAYDACIIAENILRGAMEERKNNKLKAIEFFNKAVFCEDKLIYNEPRDWLLPTRQYLGNALFNAGKYAEAISVFKRDLTINPENGWALTGLVYSYKSLQQSSNFALVQKRLKTAWQIKDVEITGAIF